MAALVERTEIEGIVFEVTQIGAKKSDKLLAWLLKRLAKSIEALEGAKDLESKLFASASGLIESLGDNDLEWLRDQLIDTITVVRTGEKGLEVKLALAPQYDVLMQGKGIARLQLLAFAIKINFADFLGESGLKSFFGDVMRKAKASSSNFQKNAVGSFGDSIGTDQRPSY